MVNRKKVQEVHVRNLSDIQRVIVDFAPRDSAVELHVSTVMRGEDETGKSVNIDVSATAKVKSRRETLIEGLDAIKRQCELSVNLHDDIQPIEVNGVLMSPPQLLSANPISWVDQLITRWFDAERDGLRIRWTIDKYYYFYDVYNNALTRKLIENDDATPG